MREYDVKVEFDIWSLKQLLNERAGYGWKVTAVTSHVDDEGAPMLVVVFEREM